MTRRGDIFGCVVIQQHCGECDQRPVAVASVPVSPTQMDLIWACDVHAEGLAVVVLDRGLDPSQHLFEISRTCRATGTGGAPCGAAGDYLVTTHGGEEVVTVCRRHMEEWKPPQPPRANATDWMGGP